MQVQVMSYQHHTLTTLTPLKHNTNIHNTAFAGSLYSIQSLTAWGVLWAELQQLNIDGSIIHAEGNIHFAKPVQEDIRCVSTLVSPQSFAQKLDEHGKVTLTMESQIQTSSEIASRFSGVYSVRK